MLHGFIWLRVTISGRLLQTRWANQTLGLLRGVKISVNIINGDAVLIDFAVHGPWCTVHYLSGQKKNSCERFWASAAK